MPTAIMLPSAINTHTQTGIGACVGGGGMMGTDSVVKMKVADQSIGMFRPLTSTAFTRQK
ncbi:MAG: hypothetical protein ABSG90_04830 [Dehalococcoidia bacterium]